jgi:hypothetical protein
MYRLMVLLVRSIKLYKEAMMRTVDNIWILQGYFIHEMGASREDVNEMCGIDEDELDKTL